MQNRALRVQSTVITFALAALVSFAVAVSHTETWPDQRGLVLAGLLLAMVTLARLYPVHLAPKMKLGVSTAPLFAAVLLLPASLAMIVAAVAVAVAAALRGGSWRQTTFNLSEAALRVGAGSAVFAVAGDGHLLTSLEPGRWLIAAPLAAAAMYLVNELSVDIIVGVQLRRSPLQDFWRRRQFDLPQEGALFLLGLLVAGISADFPWAVALLAVPSFVVHRSLRDGVALRAQTREALEELADIVDMRDHYTYEHSRRVAALARATAEMLGLPAHDVEAIEMAGRVHDIGKIGIKSTVLLSPQALTDLQWVEMRKHPEVGARLVARFPQFARGRDIVLAHHERWDGTGYPRGLAREHIPMGARVLAVTDAWDAMTSHRSYRRALEIELVYAELEAGRGTQFDPVVLDAFRRVLAAHPELAAPATPTIPDIDGPLTHAAPA